MYFLPNYVTRASTTHQTGNCAYVLISFAHADIYALQFFVASLVAPFRN